MYVASPALEPATPSGAGRSVNARERAPEPGAPATDGADRAFPGERVTLSGAARAASAAAGTVVARPTAERDMAATGAGSSGRAANGPAAASPATDAPGDASEGARSGGPGSATGREGVPGVRGAERLDAREQVVVAQLEARDAHVRAHEAAHQGAGGGLTGGASYTYKLGPDGKEYAVGGEVPIRTGGGTTPDEKIADAESVRAAALAPADPSPQDLAVAAAALQTELTARADKAKAAVRAYARIGKGSGGGGGGGAAASQDEKTARGATSSPTATAA